MIKFWKESEKGDWVHPLLVCLFVVCRLGSSTAHLSSSSRSVRDRRGGSEEREKREREDDDGGDGGENDEDEDGASVRLCLVQKRERIETVRKARRETQRWKKPSPENSIQQSEEDREGGERTGREEREP